MSRKFFALVLAFTLIFSMTACGGKPESAASDLPPSSASAPESDSAPASPEEAAPDDGGSAAGGELEAYIEQNKALFDQMISSMTEDGMQIQISAQGDTLFYDFTFDEGALDGVGLETAQSQLDVALEGMETTFNNILAALQVEVPSASSIVVNYRTHDGGLISTREFDGTVRSGGSDLPSGEVYDSMEAFVAANREELDRMAMGMASDGISVTVDAQGDTLIYNFTYEDGLDDLGESMREVVKLALEEAMAGQTDTFLGILATMKNQVPSVERIRVNYLDADGSVITSMDFPN